MEAESPRIVCWILSSSGYFGWPCSKYQQHMWTAYGRITATVLLICALSFWRVPEALRFSCHLACSHRFLPSDVSIKGTKLRVVHIRTFFAEAISLSLFMPLVALRFALVVILRIVKPAQMVAKRKLCEESAKGGLVRICQICCNDWKKNRRWISIRDDKRKMA